jgi:biotin operon repressor
MSPDKRAALLEDIARILATCHGRENAISAPAIAEALGKPPGYERTIRETISLCVDRLWDRGITIVTTSGGGYWIAKDEEEISANLAFLLSLTLTIVERLAAFLDLMRRQGFHPRPDQAARLRTIRTKLKF